MAAAGHATAGHASAASPDTTDTLRRPELTALSDEQKHRVLRQAGRRTISCRRCGGARLRVGDALYLGFLFRSEDTDAYLVALSCTNPACPAPRTGIKVSAFELYGRRGAPA